MTTVSEIKKGIVREYSRLTPEEWATFDTEERRKLAFRVMAGEDVTADLAELDTLYEKYILSTDCLSYARYWKSMHNEVQKIGRRILLEMVVPGRIREHAHIAHILIISCREWMLSKEEKTGPIWESRREYITGYLERYQALGKEIKTALKDDVWDEMGILRPEFSDILESTWALDDLQTIAQGAMTI